MATHVFIIASACAILPVTVESRGYAQQELSHERALFLAQEEARTLVGIWVSTSPEVGRGRGHLFEFRLGHVNNYVELGWRLSETIDGKPMIQRSKIHVVKLDPTKTPKEITITEGKGKDKITRLGIYELTQDSLKVNFANSDDRERPKDFKGAEAINLVRDKLAEYPFLRHDLIEIKPTVAFYGHEPVLEFKNQCSKAPIRTESDFEKHWPLLKGKADLPNVDFTREFVLVRTHEGGKLSRIDLVLRPGKEIVEASLHIQSDEKKLEGFTFAIGVFSREYVRLNGSTIVLKKD